MADHEDKAKTPDELEAEAARAERDAADADAAVRQNAIDAEHVNDDQQMADGSADEERRGNGRGHGGRGVSRGLLGRPPGPLKKPLYVSEADQTPRRRFG